MFHKITTIFLIFAVSVIFAMNARLADKVENNTTKIEELDLNQDTFIMGGKRYMYYGLREEGSLRGRGIYNTVVMAEEDYKYLVEQEMIRLVKEIQHADEK